MQIKISIKTFTIHNPIYNVIGYDKHFFVSNCLIIKFEVNDIIKLALPLTQTYSIVL